MELKTHTKLDVSGDRYNDLLLYAECVVVKVNVELQLRFNELRLEYRAHLLAESGMSGQVLCPLSC